MGHSDSGQFSMKVYARAVKRRERLTGKYRGQFDSALEWASMGTSADFSAPTGVPAENAEAAETALARAI